MRVTPSNLCIIWSRSIPANHAPALTRGRVTRVQGNGLPCRVGTAPGLAAVVPVTPRQRDGH